jgi:hypothetical protein
MNIKEIAKTELILKVLYVLSWIIFIGVCADAGGLIFSTFFTVVSNPFGATYFWNNADLSGLYAWDPIYFFIETFLTCMAAVIKAFMFYLIIKILHGKKFDAAQPFTKDVGRFIFNVSYLSFGIGLLSAWGAKHAKWFVTQGVTMPDIQDLGLAGADVWLFMGVTLIVIGQIFKRGIEIQSENELTV